MIGKQLLPPSKNKKKKNLMEAKPRSCAHGYAEAQDSILNIGLFMFTHCLTTLFVFLFRQQEQLMCYKSNVYNIKSCQLLFFAVDTANNWHNRWFLWPIYVFYVYLILIQKNRSPSEYNNKKNLKNLDKRWTKKMYVLITLFTQSNKKERHYHSYL